LRRSDGVQGDSKEGWSVALLLCRIGLLVATIHNDR
jgi:hypothetical protein